MARKYSDYIELNPGYESVVDEKTEERQENFWKRYIVHEDMVEAVRKVSRALRRDDEEDKKSFWFHGTYGTGKTYSALVLRHLLEDDIPEVEEFFRNRKALNEVKDKFIGLRKRGKYLVVWKSGGCDAVNTASKLLLEMENAIKLALVKHNYEYTGMNSLIQSIQDRIKDPSNNWEYIFNDDPNFSYLSMTYPSVDVFKDKVIAGDLKACEAAKEVIAQKGWGLVADIDTFKAWIKDVIEGNNLDNTGIVFIWDEFTEYLKNSNDMNVLQDISEFCKVTPFYMMFIVHKHSGIATDLSEDRYEHMVARFHHQQFNINKETAYRLIGESIDVKNGMENSWNDIRKDLLSSIQGRIPEYTGLDNIGVDDIQNLSPIHPMTVSLMSEVAGNFAASQRTLFRFLKDEHESEEGVGFIHYINHNGPDDWKWLTPDQLWDYFFMRPSDMRSFGDEASNCRRHYDAHQGRLESSPDGLKILKTAMLLLAVTGSRQALMKSGAATRKAKGIKPTVSTLISCFYGQIPDNQVRTYLEELEKLDIILTRKDAIDSWLELPFNRDGNSRNEVDKEIEKLKKANTPYILLSSGVFGSELRDQFIPKVKAISNRIEVETCWGDNSSISLRLPELMKKLQKYPYKFGVLLLVVGDNEQYFKIQETAAKTALEDTSERLIVVVLKKPLDNDTLHQWYENKALTQTAAGNNFGGSSSRFDTTAKSIVREWTTSAVTTEMMAYYKEAKAPTIYNNSNFVTIAEKYILSLFTAAPETIIPTITAYKSGGEKAALAGIEKQDGGNQQVKNIIEKLKPAQIWDIDDPNDYKIDSDNSAAKSVAVLYQFIENQFTNNSGKIDLTDLWNRLQDPPFGYYDTLVCNFLLGFVMRHYKDSDYTWYDGSNPFTLRADNLAVMISKMCKGHSSGHYLSAISATERLFREYTKRLFEMNDDEVANADSARKNVRVKIAKSGMPFWMVKYIPEDRLGGVKASIEKIIDSYIPFIRHDGDQTEVMEEINNNCKGKQAAINVITKCLKDKALLFKGFENYIGIVNSLVLNNATSNGFSINEILSALSSLLQGEKYEWLESRVAEKLEILLCDIDLVGCINLIMHNKRKSIDKISEDLANIFYHQKIPKTVFEKCAAGYSETVMLLYAISHNEWNKYDLNKKREIICLLQQNVEEAWRYISHPEIILEKYLADLGFTHSLEEILYILGKLSEEGFQQREESFKTIVLSIRRDLEYQQLVEHLNRLWEGYSGSKSVNDWCNKNGIPIQWVLPDNENLINILKACHEGARRDVKELRMCVDEMADTEKFEILKNSTMLNEFFLDHISKGYSGMLLNKVEDLKNYLRNNISPKVYTWNSKFAEIRSCTQEFIKTEMKNEVLGKAQDCLDNMTEKDLRQRIKVIMENDPDLCMYFLENF